MIYKNIELNEYNIHYYKTLADNIKNEYNKQLAYNHIIKKYYKMNLIRKFMFNIYYKICLLQVFLLCI